MSKNHGAGRFVVPILLLGAVLALPLAAQVAEVSVSPTGVTLLPQVEYAKLVLVVSGEERWVRREFGPGETPAISLYDAAGEPLPDGTYAWELRVMPRVGSLKSEEFANPRVSVDGALREEGRAPAPQIQSGFFTIANGVMVSPDLVEPGVSESGFGEANPFQEGTVLANNDGIIRNSLCVGFDCPNNPAFGFTTILMLENNTRILFDDTSTLAGFPNADWQLTANDSASGGANKFSIEETSAGRVPFTIRGGAPSNSLFVDSGGRIGRRTATPVLEFHIVDGDTPSIRLEQDNSSGFEPQTWDIAGNETNFFVRDATGGSALPFRIRPGAGGNALFIDVGGKVGMGTSSPAGNGLEVRRSTGASATLLQLTNNATVNYVLSNSNTGVSWNVGTFGADHFAISRVGSGFNEFVVRTGGDVEVPQGTVVHSSSRSVKTDIEPVDPAAVLAKVKAMPVATWRYNRGQEGAEALHLGPMAEDFYAAFGLGNDERGIAFSDASGVALAAIQGLSSSVDEREAELLARNAALEERIARLEALLAALTADSE